MPSKLYGIVFHRTTAVWTRVKVTALGERNVFALITWNNILST